MSTLCGNTFEKGPLLFYNYYDPMYINSRQKTRFDDLGVKELE